MKTIGLVATVSATVLVIIIGSVGMQAHSDSTTTPTFVSLKEVVSFDHVSMQCEGELVAAQGKIQGREENGLSTVCNDVNLRMTFWTPSQGICSLC